MESESSSGTSDSDSSSAESSDAGDDEAAPCPSVGQKQDVTDKTETEGQVKISSDSDDIQPNKDCTEKVSSEMDTSKEPASATQESAVAGDLEDGELND